MEGLRKNREGGTETGALVVDIYYSAKKRSELVWVSFEEYKHVVEIPGSH